MLYRNIYLNFLWMVLRILQDIRYDFDDATMWHIGMYIIFIIKLYDDFIWWWDVMRTRWWLRSTTGSYGRFVVETAYGEAMIQFTEAVWEMLAWEEWLGCRHDASPMLNILGSTPMWVLYMIFSSFHDIKSICIMFLQNLYVLWKRYTGGL